MTYVGQGGKGEGCEVAEFLSLVDAASNTRERKVVKEG